MPFTTRVKRAVVTNSLIEHEERQPHHEMVHGDHLLIDTDQGRTTVSIRPNGDIEIYTTNAPGKPQPRLLVTPITGNEIRISAELD